VSVFAIREPESRFPSREMSLAAAVSGVVLPTAAPPAAAHYVPSGQPSRGLASCGTWPEGTAVMPSLRWSGRRQKERTWFATVSFVPEPSGSNEYLQAPSNELDDLSVMRWFGTNSVNTSNPSIERPAILATQL
jgi:hypothetical protein